METKFKKNKKSQALVIGLVLIVAALIIIILIYYFSSSSSTTGNVILNISNQNPIIIITTGPESVLSNTNFTIGWIINNYYGNTTNTSIYYDDKSVQNPKNTLDYRFNSVYQCENNYCRLPNTFSTSIKINQPGTYYFRALSIIDGKTYWSSEIMIAVNNK